MERTYYLFNAGRLSRQDNTLVFQAMDETGKELKPKFLPIESVDDLYAFGSLDVNSALLNYLGQQGIHIHFFDYYEHYTGSFAPREYLRAGKMLIEQTKAYLDPERRLYLAKKFVLGGSFHILKNLKYYNRRGDYDLSTTIRAIDVLESYVSRAQSVGEVMGYEGQMRQSYYSAFNSIMTEFHMVERSKRPPENEVNALISFGNTLCYSVVLSRIYHTQLNPTISFLHEPGYRRHSLALDLAEIFKPLIVDTVIFRLVNRKQIRPEHFDRHLNGCLLNPQGRKIFVEEFERRLNETIMYPSLNRQVSYRHIIKLECYKLAKYLLGVNEEYKPYKALLKYE